MTAPECLWEGHTLQDRVSLLTALFQCCISLAPVTVSPVFFQDPVRFEDLLSIQYCKLGASVLYSQVVVQWAVVWESTSLSAPLQQSASPKVRQGWEMPLPALLLGPDSSPEVSPTGVWVSLQPALCSPGGRRGRGGLQQDEESVRARALGAGSAGTGLQDRVMIPLGDSQSTSLFGCSACFCPLVTCLLSPSSSLLISLVTLGFHTALRAAKAWGWGRCSSPPNLYFISV